MSAHDHTYMYAIDTIYISVS